MKRKHERKSKQSPAVDAGKSPPAQSFQQRQPPSPAASKFRSLPWVLAALIAVNLFIYAQVRRHEFIHWDDPGYVSQNSEVARGLTWEGVGWAFTTGYQANWHPLTWLSHMLDVELFGMTPGAHHAVSVFFHIANTLLLFWILFRMTAAVGRSAFVAGLFAAHPLHVESIAWTAERKDVLCMFFTLLSIWAYLAYVRKPSALLRLSAAALFALALMAKPMAVSLPFLLILLDFWPLGRLRFGAGQWRAWLRLIREKALWIAIALASGATTLLVQWRGGSFVGMDARPWGSRAANALASYVAYLRDMIWPANLSVFYPFTSLPALWIFACFLALAGVSVLAIRLAGRHPYLFVGWMWYLAALVPVIGLVQVGSQARADRYTYLPLIGIFIVAAWGITKMFERLRSGKVPLAIAGGVLVCALAVAARTEAGYWKNGVVLWSHALDSHPESYLAHLNLGNEYFNRGDEAAALRHFREALRLSPNSAESHNSIGVALLKQGDAAGALKHFRLAVHLKPNYAEARRNLGARLVGLGEIDEATSHLAAALSVNAQDPLAHYEIGLALFKQGKNDEAIASFSEALRLKPGIAEAHNWRGNALSSQGKQDEAIGQYREAVRLKPDFAEAHNNWGIALAVAGKFDEAITQFEKALRANPDMAEAHNGLANALSSQGKMEEAVVHYKKAIEIAPDYAEARRNLGDVFLYRRQIDEAIAQYREAIRIRPDMAEARYNIGIALMTRGRRDEAIVQWTEVLRMNPENTGAHANLGVALMQKGRPQEAIPHFKEVLRADPDNRTVNDLLKKASGE